MKGAGLKADALCLFCFHVTESTLPLPARLTRAAGGQTWANPRAATTHSEKLIRLGTSGDAGLHICTNQ